MGSVCIKKPQNHSDSSDHQLLDYKVLLVREEIALSHCYKIMCFDRWTSSLVSKRSGARMPSSSSSSSSQTWKMIHHTV